MTSNRRYSPWRAIGATLVLLLMTVPCRWRFAAACWIAHCFAPLIRLIPTQRVAQLLCEQQRLVVQDRPVDKLLFLLLNYMTRSGVRVQPRLRLHGLHILEDALLTQHGTVIVGPHCMLGSLVLWYLEQQRHKCITLAGKQLDVPCSGTPMDALLASRSQLTRAFGKLREGATLLGCATTNHPPRPRVRVYTRLNQRLMIDDALLQLAIACQAKACFLFGYLDTKREIVLRFGRPDPHPATAEDYAQNFADFIWETLRERDITASDRWPQAHSKQRVAIGGLDTSTHSEALPYTGTSHIVSAEQLHARTLETELRSRQEP